MNCPSCHSGLLSPATLEQDLPCHRCPDCSGCLLPLSPYVDWVVSRHSAVEGHHNSAEVFAADSKQALACPTCSRIMVKYKVKPDGAHGLDYCFSCEHVWLDCGEWEYLKAEGLETHITSISTDAWQRKLREQLGARIRIGKFQQSIGAEAFQEVERFRKWLDDQPGRESILRYLSVHEQSGQ